MPARRPQRLAGGFHPSQGLRGGLEIRPALRHAAELQGLVPVPPFFVNVHAKKAGPGGPEMPRREKVPAPARETGFEGRAGAGGENSFLLPIKNVGAQSPET